MNLGNHSLSLAVKNIRESQNFYEKLGFKVFMGNANEKWLIMKNHDCIIGLFQDIIPQNIITFNPGWDHNAQEVNPFTDIRLIQAQLKQSGISIINEIEPNANGPASFMIGDSDGNLILFDQHR